MNDKHYPAGTGKGGQFAEKDFEREELVAAMHNYSEAVERNIREISSQKGKNKSREEFFGEEFTGVKGAEAIEKLLKEKRGHVDDAFERPEIGGINLVWGDENGGLQHTILKRDRLFAKGVGKISGLDMVKKIPEIIEKGVLDTDNKGRINIDYNGYRVGIMPAFYGKKLNWIVTAMEILQ